jgi:hypothetical protein
VIRSNEFVMAVIGLTTLNVFLSICGACRELVGPVHPIYPSIDVVFIARPNLEDARNPIVLGPLARLFRVRSLLSLDRRFIGHEDEALAEVLGAIY